MLNRKLYHLDCAWEVLCKKNLIIIIIIIIIISLFNEDDILSYRLSNIWSSTMKLVQICLKHIYNTINTHYLHFKDVE